MSKHPVVCAAVLVCAVGGALASSVVGLSVEDQARLSKLVVAGKVISQAGVDDPENGIETAVSLAVTEVFKGAVRPGDVVIFHTRGGRLGEDVSDAVGEAKLQTGTEVLVFIEDVGGRLYNLGLSMGVWSLKTDRGGRTVAVRALEDGLEVVGDVALEFGPISLSEMAQRVDRAGREPEFEHPMLRETQRARR